MELKIKLQGKNAIVSGTTKEIKKIIKDMNTEYNDLKQSLVNTVQMPETNKIVDFIESKPDYTHSMPDILDEFIGSDANLRANRKIYDLIFRKSKEARSLVEGRHNGIFKGEKETPTGGEKRSLRRITIYKFHKNG